MDELMLRHAQKEGVKVFEETKVEFDFGGDPHTSHPIFATWVKKDGNTGKIAFDWLVDASDRVGVMSTKYLRNRQMRENLRNVTVWGYWKDVKRHGVGTKRANSAWFEALTSIVQNVSNKKRATPKANGSKASLSEHYLDQLQYVPGVQELIGGKGTFIPGLLKVPRISVILRQNTPETISASLEMLLILGLILLLIRGSYCADGALSASTSICASMKGQIDEIASQAWHDAKVGIAHTNEVNADGADKSFEMFRPVIFGLADSQNKLTDAKVHDMMEVCRGIFDPHVGEHVDYLKLRYGVDLVNTQVPVFGKAKIEELAKDDEMGESGC
ncbi:hypothetical protein BYT27DRAFT_7216279 [Phlegmacium glaucopus]|nr:hypothetical protein BYT27DRAFT_7216279 [Phlegmacium glaucopus]